VFYTRQKKQESREQSPSLLAPLMHPSPCITCIKESQKGEGARGHVCLRREREMKVTVTMSVEVTQTPTLAAEARRRLGTPRKGFLKEGTASQASSGE